MIKKVRHLLKEMETLFYFMENENFIVTVVIHFNKFKIIYHETTKCTCIHQFHADFMLMFKESEKLNDISNYPN